MSARGATNVGIVAGCGAGIIHPEADAELDDLALAQVEQGGPDPDRSLVPAVTLG